ncbi:MAG: radical SAM protein [Selenomonas bovis]|nr:radical SAM protein [Selenomonas bovis]
MLYVSHREQVTEVLGPGRRYALWLQGCKKRCPNCVFPWGQPLHEHGTWMSSDALFEEICSATDRQKLRGITISGGEPFLQAAALLPLIQDIKEKTALDIMMYSGYTLAELSAQHDASIDGILAHIDLLVDGEYIESQNTNTAYRGSDNQVIHFLSPKYLPYKKRMEKLHNRSVEFVTRDIGDVFIIGIPAKDFREHFLQAAARREEQRIK